MYVTDNPPCAGFSVFGATGPADGRIARHIPRGTALQ